MTSAIELIVTDLRGKLNGQLAALESARTRAAVALSVSGVVAGLFGPRLTTHPGGWSVAAIIALAVTGIMALYVLKPRKLRLWPEADGWRTWAADYQKWTETYNQPDNSGGLLASKMADDMARWYGDNKCTMNRMQWALTLAFLGVAVQLVCWTVPLFMTSTPAKTTPPNPPTVPLPCLTRPHLGQAAGAAGLGPSRRFDRVHCRYWAPLASGSLGTQHG